jgi:hypothetical protein
MRLIVGSLAVLALTGSAYNCSTGEFTAPSSKRTAEQAAGTWALPGSMPGITTEFTLVADDTTLSGTGFFSIEAGRAGTLTVTGYATGADIELDVLWSDGSSRHFRGQLHALDRLSGIWWNTPVGDPVDVSFDRVPTPH